MSLLSAPREVLYDAPTQSLRSLPINELKLLREASIGLALSKPLPVAAGASLALLASNVTGSTGFDLGVEIALNAADTAELSLLILAASADETNGAPAAQVTLTIAVGAVVGGLRAATLSASPGVSNASFAIPAAELTLSLRVLVDRNLVESFVGGGRAVVTSPVGKSGDMAAAKVFLVNKGSKALTVSSVQAFEMSCGRASYPGYLYICLAYNHTHTHFQSPKYICTTHEKSVVYSKRVARTE